MMTNAEKVLENRLRRIAARRGFTLNKNRVRDHLAVGYGLYVLVHTNAFGVQRTFEGSLSEVSEHLGVATKPKRKSRK